MQFNDVLNGEESESKNQQNNKPHLDEIDKNKIQKRQLKWLKRR